MFDVAFTELVVIFIVALVVIGPERLPKVARTLGHMFGHLRRYAAQVRADMQHEMYMAEFEKMQGGIRQAARETEQALTAEARVEHPAAQPDAGESAPPARK